MPESPEIETDNLRERIDEELERTGGRLLRVVAFTTACLAAFAALASLRAGATVNEALLTKNEAVEFQAKASDQWAYYQAKGVKGAVANASAAVWTALGKTPPPAIATSGARYAAQQDSIAATARALEHERDMKSVEAEHLLHQHHGFANAVALLQVAIALGAVTALTRSRSVYLISLLVGASGVILFSWSML